MLATFSNTVKTIRFRLISVTLLAVGLPLLIFIRLFNDSLWAFYLSQLETQLEATANIVSEVAEPILRERAPGYRDALAEEVGRWDRLMGIRIMVADESGTILSGTVGFASLKVGTKITESGAPGMMSAINGTKNSTTWRSPDRDYEESMYINIPIRHSVNEQVLGAVRVSYSLGKVKSGVATIRQTLLLGITVYIVLLILTVLLLAGSLARPVESLNKSALKLSGGDLDHRLTPDGPVELQQLARTLNLMTERLSGLENLRRRYVSDVSHELRAPLAAIRTMTETMIAHGAEDPALMERYLPRIISQTERLARLASQLLDLAQIESGSNVHLTTPVDMAEVIKEVVETAEQGAKEQEVKVRMDVPAGLPTVRADRDRMVQMLLNLVGNGIQYTPSGGTVTISARASREQLVLMVTDDGPGIPEESLPHLFERFYRVDKARTPNRGGAGLGLSIVREIVKSHGGEIQVESEPDKGTVFRIELPLGRTEEK